MEEVRHSSGCELRDWEQLVTENPQKAAQLLNDTFSFAGYYKGPPKNLSFAGGGPKVVVYGPVLEELDRYGLLKGLSCTTGTSGGAFPALTLALGYRTDQINNMLGNLCFKTFLDRPTSKLTFLDAKKILSSAQLEVLDFNASSFFSDLKALWSNKNLMVEGLTVQRGNIKTVCREKGMYYTTTMEETIKHYIEIATEDRHLTFGELHTLVEEDGRKFRDLYIHILHHDSDGPHHRVLSYETEEYKDVCLFSAVAASCALPLLFTPVKLWRKRRGTDELELLPGYEVCSDGGVTYNNPLETFDKVKYVEPSFPEEYSDIPCFNWQTWGLCPQVPLEPNEEPDNLIQVLFSAYKAYDNAQSEQLKQDPRNEFRLIRLPTQGVALTDIEPLDPVVRKKINTSSRKKTRAFLEKVGIALPDTEKRQRDRPLVTPRQRIRNLEVKAPTPPPYKTWTSFSDNNSWRCFGTLPGWNVPIAVINITAGFFTTLAYVPVFAGSKALGSIDCTVTRPLKEKCDRQAEKALLEIADGSLLFGRGVVEASQLGVVALAYYDTQLGRPTIMD